MTPSLQSHLSPFCPFQESGKMTEMNVNDADSHKDPDQDSKLPAQGTQSNASREKMNRNDSHAFPVRVRNTFLGIAGTEKE
jgi:hypothetical protein